MIEFKKVSKSFGQTVAADGIDITFADGEISVLIGPSGCGKTTLMKMINRLVDPDSGDIQIDGRSVLSLDPVELRRSIGYAIQEVGLFPHYSIFDNIALVPRLLKWPS
ncbi:MAG: ATP-binding cassette domain-containing protein, partial [Leptospiraceae bacterium]|nr:ATP-binding cassette domain-containing protein [Leptospiraceae bacterium]